jgi:hypothetical protein
MFCSDLQSYREHFFRLSDSMRGCVCLNESLFSHNLDGHSAMPDVGETFRIGNCIDRLSRLQIRALDAGSNSERPHFNIPALRICLLGFSVQHMRWFWLSASQARGLYYY